jgi:hypothetical protein
VKWLNFVSKGGNGGSGGAGAGGGILLKANSIIMNGTINDLDGANSNVSGGTVKIFCVNTGTISGNILSGRLYMTDNCAVGLSINSSYWANLRNGSLISGANVGDSVLMMVDGIGLASQLINYSIIKQGYPSWNPFNWFSHVVIQISTLGVSDWQTYETGTFYFNVKISNLENQSNDMAVIGATNTSNALPVAIITHPNATDYRFSTDCVIDFTQASYDEDDLLRLTWNFGDGNITSFDNYSWVLTPSIANTNHSYHLSGVYSVSLTAKEMIRNQSDVDYAGVHVLKEGLNVMPVITLPENGVGYGMWVAFNASQSYVANCSLNMPGYNFTACNLQCKYIHAPGTMNITGRNYELRMNWVVKNPAGAEELGTSGNWSTNYTDVVEFSNFFENPGQHNAILTMDYIQK